MKGYWRKPAQTAEVMLPGGWLRTGDGGSFDADGFLYLHDRLKDMLISGGENVYPAEVESVLTGHPAVAEVAVVGVPSARWGESPYAAVVLRPGAEVTAASSSPGRETGWRTSSARSASASCRTRAHRVRQTAKARDPRGPAGGPADAVWRLAPTIRTSPVWPATGTPPEAAA